MQDLVMPFQVIFGIVALLFFYLICSFNTARIFVFVTRQKGILETGTSNAGANNVWRVYSEKFGGKIGALAGMIVMLADIGKGMMIVYLARDIFSFPEVFTLVCAIIGMAGHNWPFFHLVKMRGGKGIALLSGALLTLHPLGIVIALVPALGLALIGRLSRGRIKKQLSGLVPFIAIPVYILAGGAESAETIGVLFAALALMYLRRINAEWQKLLEQPSKIRALWYLLIYDRATNDPLKL